MKRYWKFLAAVCWMVSTSYLYGEGSFGGFGMVVDEKPLALAGLIISNLCLMDHVIIGLVERINRSLRGKPREVVAEVAD